LENEGYFLACEKMKIGSGKWNFKNCWFAEKKDFSNWFGH
jgi:hypothetical protein